MSGLRRFFLGAILLTLFATSCIFWLRQQMWQEDFSTWPPDRVYQMVLQQTPPAGVSHIQASGRHYAIKRWIWLRIQATQPVLDSLAKLGTPLTEAEMQQRLQMRISANSQYDDIDHQKVGWDDRKQIAAPVAYECFLGKNDPWLWNCLLIFDYPNRTVYIQADGG